MLEDCWQPTSVAPPIPSINKLTASFSSLFVFQRHSNVIAGEQMNVLKFVALCIAAISILSRSALHLREQTKLQDSTAVVESSAALEKEEVDPITVYAVYQLLYAGYKKLKKIYNVKKVIDGAKTEVQRQKKTLSKIDEIMPINLQSELTLMTKEVAVYTERGLERVLSYTPIHRESTRFYYFF